MREYTIFTKVEDLVRFRSQITKEESVGFVPTMGALHNGHLSLLQKSIQENTITICSIFVNPIQFNDKNDFEKYPRQVESDIKQAVSVGCSYFFIPSVDEMFPEEDKTVYNFGHLDQVMEGAHRPGHFRGVAVVVRRFFEIILPTKAYFGLKDYQQLKIIEKLVAQFNLSPKIIACEILRESNGLAMSSRNERLTANERADAAIINQTLQKIATLEAGISAFEMNSYFKNALSKFEYMNLEYFELSDSETLESVNFLKKGIPAMGFVVVNVAGVRLIDNIKIIL